MTSEAELNAVGLLADPVRRSLYTHVARQPAEVSRDAAARPVGVSRDLAAFHLDKLVAGGLLEPVFRRLSGRSGPGAGRPAKLYRRGTGEVGLSIPPREYAFAARILARALRLGEGGGALDAVSRAAQEVGADLGRDVALAAGRRPTRPRLERALLDTLEVYGYQPFRTDEGVLRLRNCPFHALAGEFRDLVCGMNLAFLTSVAEAAAIRHLEPVQDRVEGYCCVAFRPAGGRGS